MVARRRSSVRRNLSRADDREPEKAMIPIMLWERFLKRGKPIVGCAWEEMDGPLAPPNSIFHSSALGEKLPNGRWRVLMCDSDLAHRLSQPKRKRSRR